MASGIELATAYVSISASTGGLGRQINQAMGAPDIAAAGEKAGKSISSRLGGVLKKSAIGVGVAAGGVLATALFKGWNRLTNIENATAKLTGLGHSAKSVKGIMDNALTSVRGTAFGLDEAATVAAGAVASGIKPGKALTRTLTLMADAATIGGTSMGEMGAIFNKVAASGKIQGDVIAQLGDRGIPILQLLSRQLGVSTEDVLGMTKKGKVSFEDFQNAMEMGLGGGEQAAKNLAKQMGISVAEVKKRVKSGQISADQWAKAIAEVGGAALKSGETTQGAFKNMGAAVGRFGATLLKGVFPIAKTVFGGITTLFDKMGDVVGPFVEKFSLGIQGLVDLVAKGDYTSNLSKAFGLEEDSAVVDWLFNVRDGFKGAGDAMRDFWRGMSGADPGKIYGGDGKMLVAPLEGMEKVGKRVRDLFLPLWDALKEAAKAAWPAVAALAAAIKQAGEDLGIGAWDLFELAIRGVTAAIEWLTPWIEKFADWVRENPDKIQAVAVGIVAFGTAMKIASISAMLLEGAVKLLNIAMRVNPIMLIVAALAGLAYWFVETQGEGETFKDKLLDIWNKIQEKVQAVIDWFKAFWGEHGAQIKAEWDEVWNGIKETFDSVWTSIQDIATSVGGWLETFWENWGERVTEFLSDAWENIKRIFSGALKVIRGWFEFFAGLFTGDWGRMWDGLKQVFSGAWDLVMGTIGFAIDRLKLLLELAWGAIKSVASAAWGGIVNGIKAIWDGIVGAVSGPIDRVMQFIQENFIDKINGFFAFLRIPIYIDPIWTAKNLNPGGGGARGKQAFSSGGYTGDVPVDEIAGVVHGREWVINAQSSARIEREHPGFLAGLNAYKGGGYVSPALGAKIAASVPGYRSGGRVRDLEIWDVQPARKAAPAPSAPQPQPEVGGSIFSTVFDAIKGALAATIRNTIGGLANLAAMGVEPFGLFGQAAAGAVRSMGAGAADWAIRTLGLDPTPLTPTLYDQGGLVQPGLTLVSNQTGRPEMLLPPDFGRQDGPVELAPKSLRALAREIADINLSVGVDHMSDALFGVRS